MVLSLLSSARDAFDRLFGSARPLPASPDATYAQRESAAFPFAPTAPHLADTPENIETEINKGLCFHCGISAWQEGPCGGMSQNYRCACCGQKLNLTRYEGQFIFSESIGVDPDIRAEYEGDPEARRRKIAAEVTARAN